MSKIVHKNLMLVLAIMGLVSACSIHNVEKQHKELKEDQSELRRIVGESLKRRAAKPRATQVKIKEGEEWLYTEFDASTSGLGIKEAVAALAQGYPVVSNLTENRNPTVRSSGKAVTIKDHLRSYELQANVAIVVSDGVIILQDAVSRQYKLPHFGSNSRASNSQAFVALSSDNLAQSESASIASGFNNNLSGSVDTYGEIAEMVQSVIPRIKHCKDVQNTQQGEGAFIEECFSMSTMGNTLTLTASPIEHANFKAVFDDWTTSATRQASVTIRTLDIDVTDLSQQSFDFTLVRNSLVQAEFSNETRGLVDVQDAGGFLTFEFLEPGLYVTGTQGVIQALNQISDVSIVASYDIQLHNNRLYTIRDFGTTRFPEQVSIQNTTGGAISTISPTVQFGEISTGKAMNILPTITDTTISLHIVSNVAELGAERPYEFGEGQLTGTTIDDRGRDVVRYVTLKDQQMVLLSSSYRREIRVNKGKTDFAPIIGDTRSGEKRIVERIFLISGSITDS